MYLSIPLAEEAPMPVTVRTVSPIILASILLATSAHAAPPDAGTLLNEQRQPGSRLPDRLPKPEELKPERPPLADSGVKVTVKGFRFTGYEGVATEAELQALAAGTIGKELGFADLQLITMKITEYLRDKKGYMLARAYLPQQDITEGLIEIAISVGRLDSSTGVKLDKSARINSRILRDMIDRVIQPGKPLEAADIERAILLMNDLPGIKAKASMEPGSTPGTTKIVINASEGPVATGSISTDNQGDRYTGTWKGTGQLSINDPFGWADQLSLSLSGAENQFQGRAQYTIPLGSSGLSGSLSYTGLYYELGGDMKSLKYNGRADTIGANISYPIVRSRETSIYTGLGFEYMIMTDSAGSQDIKRRHIPVANGSLSGTFYDSFWGGGLTSANLMAYGGNIDMSGVIDAQTQDNQGPKAAGGFFRATYNLARLQKVTQLLSLSGQARGQLTAFNLDSSQKFILGGPNGVRAYPVGEASGDEGHAFTAEARLELPFMPSWAATQLVGFFDTGWVKLHYNNWPGAVTSATGRNDYWLSGGGVGLNIGKDGLYLLKASYAHTIDNNKGRTTTGKNSDNRSENEQVWLQGMFWF
jgi:hemolysin activation/secretion protein